MRPQLKVDGKPVADDATVTISARLLAEAFVAYAQQGANGLAAAQAGEAAKRQVQAMGNVVLAAAAAVQWNSGRRRWRFS